jgi:hypothetical protein
MKHFLLLAFFLPLIFPGCGNRFSDWAADHVKHGKVREIHKERVVKYLRSIRIYQDFSTVGIFDALWLSHEVRQAYIDVFSSKYVLDKEKEEELLRKQRIENDNFISFYVLSYIPDTSINLGEKNCPWAIDLKVNNKLYVPKVVETVELSPEYLTFLSRILNKYKNVHLVKFAAKDENGDPIITARTRILEMRLSTIDRSTSLVWHIDKNQNLVKDQEE